MECPQCGKNYYEEFTDSTYCFGCGHREMSFQGKNHHKKDDLKLVLFPLGNRDYQKLKREWGIKREQADHYGLCIGMDQYGSCWLKMPIYNQFGKEVHSQLRAWSEGCRRKYLTKIAPEPGIVWYSWGGEQVEVAVIVEGILDGIRVGAIMQTIALLGHDLNDARIATIRKLSKRQIIMLDADALKESLTIQKKLGILDTVVVVLEKGDPTDYSDEELEELIRGASSSQETA